METLTERVKVLEKKVLKLEGGNLLKEDSTNPYAREPSEKEYVKD